jgi:phosphatidylserine/phosphatidylglycerophosphate/cardiolipin synthase-like enzyme
MLGWLNDSTLNFHLWSYEAEDKMELMHVKCMIADNSVAYIGSANFSYGGSKRNIEIGLIIRDGPTLQALEDVFRYLTSGNVDEVKLINYTLLRKSDVI